LNVWINALIFSYGLDADRIQKLLDAYEDAVPEKEILSEAEQHWRQVVSRLSDNEKRSWAKQILETLEAKKSHAGI
jgi:flagellar biosynthesis/type III secretory pathway protein FliH